MVTRLLLDAGADLGDPDSLYPGDRWNPDGYYEQPEIHRINMPLVNGLWWKLAYLRLPSEGTILRRASRRAAEIQATAEKYRGKVVKETRFCLTLPAWLKHGAKVAAILLCLREPAAVARSLSKRNRISRTRGLSLWILHNQRLLASSGQIPLRIVRYERLLDPDTFSGELVPALRHFGMSATPAQLETLRASVIKPAQNHFSGSPPINYPPEVEALWQQLTSRHRAQS